MGSNTLPWPSSPIVLGSNDTTLNGYASLQVQLAQGGVQQVSTSNSNWYPYKLTNKASYLGGSLAETETFYSTNAILMSLSHVGLPSRAQGTLELTGPVQGPASYSAGNRKLLVTNSYAVAFPDTGSAVTFTDSAGNPSAGPVAGGSWVLPITTRAPSAINLVVAIAQSGQSDSAVLAELPSGSGLRMADGAIQARRHDMDATLARVPQPTNFNLKGINVGGATPELVRARYYEAFVAVDGGDYPPLGTFYMFESLAYLDLEAYVNPSTAWSRYLDIFKGEQSCGFIPAEEVLPERFAETGLELYGSPGTGPSSNRHTTVA